MSSPSVLARNRANAQKSTGPKTAGGKAAVAQNARRHGGTAKPDPASVAAWTRIILDKPDLGPGDFLRDGGRMAAALSLAQAEARLYSAWTALDQFENAQAAPPEDVYGLQSAAEQVNGILQDDNMRASDRRAGLSLLRRIARQVAADTCLGGKRHQLLQRYVREAQGNRRRAFAAWLICLDREREARLEGA